MSTAEQIERTATDLGLPLDDWQLQLLQRMFPEHAGPSAVCPECASGKHGNCDGRAWDDEADELTDCSCACR